MFAILDTSGDGQIEYKELHESLRQPKVQLDELLQPGALGGIETAARNEIGLRTSEVTGTLLGAETLRESDNVRQALGDALAERFARVRDLFLQWDITGDGKVDRTELHRAVTHLGLECTQGESDALFDSWDTDGSGSIDYRELHTLLKVRMASAEAPKALVGTDGAGASDGGDGAADGLPSARAAARPTRLRLGARPMVPIRDGLLELLPRVSPRVSSALRTYATEDGTVARDLFVHGLLEMGRRPCSRSSPMSRTAHGLPLFSELGSRGRDAVAMTHELQKLFGELHQPDHGDSDGIPIIAIPHRIRKLKEKRDRERAAATLPPIRGAASAGDRVGRRVSPSALPSPSPRVQRARFVKAATAPVEGPHKLPRPPSKKEEVSLLADEIVAEQTGGGGTADVVQRRRRQQRTRRSRKSSPSKKATRVDKQGHRWLPIIGTAASNEAKLRECQEKGVQLRQMINQIIDGGPVVPIIPVSFD